MSSQEVFGAILFVLKHPKANAVAKSYCSAYFDLPQVYSGEELEKAQKVQLKYVVNNITHLRGDGVKEIRAILKKESEQ